MTSSMITFGAVGYKEGIPCEEIKHTEVFGILLWYTKYRIQAIQFQYVDEYGNLVLSDRHGSGDNDLMLATMKFSRDPVEYIVKISGNYDNFGVRSLKFETNCSVYGPFGGTSDKSRLARELSFDRLDRKTLAGFHGTASDWGLSFGIYMKPHSIWEEDW